MSRFIAAPSARSSQLVQLAIGLANTVTALEMFYEEIADKPEGFDQRFTSASATPAIVAEILRNSTTRVTVHVAKARRKTLGWTNTGDYQNVYLNVRRLDRTSDDIARTLVHEWVHAVDDIHPLDFHHGNNSPKGKGNSAPYWIDHRAGKLLAKLVAAGGLPPSEVETPLHLADGEFIEPERESDIDGE